ncbi:MAG: helix-turn-helix transcriptional regulator [Clostridia bacterium]|nr:helix-turn-helix transcriptional regulator [Clostridia bacterium]
MSYYLVDHAEYPQKTLPVNCVKWSGLRQHSGFHLHNHQELEIIAVRAGKMQITADTDSYTVAAGEVIVFNPYVLHAGFPEDETTEYLCITFSLTQILNFPKSPLTACAAALTEEVTRFDVYYPSGAENRSGIYEMTEELYDAFYQKSNASECRTMGILYSLLAFLFEHHYHENEGKSTGRRNIKFMRGLAQYLNEHFSETIGTEDAAEALFMSSSWFSHTFHRHFGCSFSKYLCQYRIQRAASMQAEPSMSLAEIAAAVGFTDYCYFSRSFKKYTGQAPAEYFRRWKMPKKE